MPKFMSIEVFKNTSIYGWNLLISRQGNLAEVEYL